MRKSIYGNTSYIGRSAPVSMRSSVDQLYTFYSEQYDKRARQIKEDYGADMKVPKLNKASFKFQWVASLADEDLNVKGRKWSAADVIRHLVTKSSTTVGMNSARRVQKDIKEGILKIPGLDRTPTVHEIRHSKIIWNQIRDEYRAKKDYFNRVVQEYRRLGLPLPSEWEGKTASEYAAEEIHDEYFYGS